MFQSVGVPKQMTRLILFLKANFAATLSWVMTLALIINPLLAANPAKRERAIVKAPTTPVRKVAKTAAPAMQASSPVTVVSAASYELDALAPEAIASAFGINMTGTTQGSAALPLPTILANTIVKVKDSAGAERLAPLFYVSPGQINFLIPAGTAVGDATITVVSSTGALSSGIFVVQKARPSFFTFNQDGQGVLAAEIVRVKADGTQVMESLAQVDPVTGRYATKPIDLGSANERVFLVMYLTGLRYGADPNNDGNANEETFVNIGTYNARPAYAGKHGTYTGLDQINFEIPRSLAGRGRLNVSVFLEPLDSRKISNLGEIEIAGAKDVGVISGFGTNTVAVGDQLRIQGLWVNGITTRNTIVRIGGVECEVLDANFASLLVKVPYGAESGYVTVLTPSGETQSPQRLQVVTSVSGVVEDTRRQPISGITVRLSGNGTPLTATTNSEGVFILRNAPAGSSQLEIDPTGSPVSSVYQKLRTRLNVVTGRDNQISRPISLQAVTGGVIVIGNSPNSTVGNPTSTSIIGENGTLKFEVSGDPQVLFPDGTARGELTFAAIEKGRVPVPFPTGYFTFNVAQIGPVGTSINPGGRLTFPNMRAFTPGTQLPLFRLEQNPNNPAMGTWVNAGMTTVSSDGQRIETAANAITETGIYFAGSSSLYSTVAITGKVVEADGITPVRRVIVRMGGQSTLTDGDGSYTLRNLIHPTISSSGAVNGLTLDATYTRPNGRVERVQRDNVSLAILGVTDIAKIVLGASDTNRPPAILAPSALRVVAGQTLDTNFVASDPDANQTVQVTVSGAPFASLIPNGGNSYALRLAPGTSATGSYDVTITATDNLGSVTTHKIIVTVQSQATGIADFTPRSGSIGTTVIITGTGLKTGATDPVVTFAGQSARIPAFVTSSTDTEVRTVVPNGAVTGTIELTNANGRLATSSVFTITATQDFDVSVGPTSLSMPQGSAANYVVTLTSPQTTFTQLAKLSVTGLPSGTTIAYEPEQITAGATSTLTLMIPGTLAAGAYPLTLRATAVIDGSEKVKTTSFTLSVLAAGVTMLTGRVLSNKNEPIIGATASLDGKSATTDAAGNFILTGVTAGTARPVMINGKTASAPNRTYPIITEPADIVAGRVNAVPFTFFLPVIDTMHEMDVVPGRDTMVTTPMVPKLSMMIPAGANLRNRDGSPVTRASLTAVEIDRTPAPLPSNLGPSIAFTSQPGSAISDIPMPVIYPNLNGTEPGTRLELWAFNHDTVKWYIYGYGKVSQDGRTIVPEVDPATGKQYGLKDFSWHFPNPNPIGGPGGDGGSGGPGGPNGPNGPDDPPSDPNDPDDPPEDDDPTCGGGSNFTSNPVDLSTGLKIEYSTDISFGGARGTINLTRLYTSDLAGACLNCPFGRGTAHNYQTRLIGTFLVGGTGRILRPLETTGRLFNYEKTDSDGSLVFSTTATTRQLGDVIRKLTNGTFEYRYKRGMIMRFDSTGRLTSEVNRNGNTTTLSYTGANLTTITDAVGRTITLTYNGNKITKATDPIGRNWNYAYDAGNRLAQVQDPLGNSMGYGYDPFSRINSITDKRNNTSKQIFYNSNGRVSEQRFADGGFEKYEYSLSGRIVTSTTVTDSLGRKYVKRFNAAGYVVGKTDELGQTFEVERDILTNLPTKTAGPCGCPENQRQFDARGNLLSYTDRIGGNAKLEYDSVFNKVTKLTDKLGRISQVSYDLRGNRTSVTNALGQITNYTYDQFGQLLSVTDPLNHQFKIEYDNQGNVTATVDPLGNRRTMEYDAIGRLTAVNDALGRRTTFEYDLLGRVITSKDPSGTFTQMEYDANGNRIGVIDGLGRNWRKIFDSRNRTIAQADPAGRSTRMQYDTEGQEISMTSPSGRVVNYNYDPRGQVSVMTDGNGNNMRFTYDNRGNLKTLADQRGNALTFSYDELFRQIGQVDPSGGVSSIEYDAEGNVAATLDRLGRRTLFSYDSLNRPTTIKYVDASVNYTYDPAGRLTQINDSQSDPIQWSYDDANRMVSETTSAGTVSYTYNQASQRASMKALNRSVVNYNYDSAGRLRTIGQGTEIFTYAYDALSRMSSLQRPNGVRTDYQFDPANRLERLTHTNASGINIEDLKYSYNEDNEISSIVSLAAATALPAAKTVGAADAANRVTQSGQANFTFDSEGQTVSKIDSQLTTTYAWDARGRLTQATLSNGQKASYSYDALGRRTSRSVGTANTSFVYDGLDVVIDRNSNGAGVDYLNGAGIDNKLRQNNGGGSLFYLADHLHSTLSLTNGSGTIVEQAGYEAFGATTGFTNTRYGFTGREKDALTGLDYYRARWYDTNNGRFVSEDPIGVNGGLNRYMYVGNRPTMFKDPTGKIPIPAIPAIVAVAVRVIVARARAAAAAVAAADGVRRAGYGAYEGIESQVISNSAEGKPNSPTDIISSAVGGAAASLPLIGRRGGAFCEGLTRRLLNSMTDSSNSNPYPGLPNPVPKPIPNN